MAVDTNKLEQFLGKFVTDLGATVHAGMVVIGDRLGLYKALAASPLTPTELAAITRTDERYIREWLASQAAGGYVTYNAQTNKFGMTEEQALTLANEDGPAFLPGAFELALGSLAAVPRITELFRSGAGMAGGARGSRVSRMREVLSSRLQRESRQLLDSRSGWRAGQTRARREGRRRWLRERSLDHPNGQGIPQLADLRL